MTGETRGQQAHRRSSRKAAGARLLVEGLEERTVPTVTVSGFDAALGTVTFTGDNSGNALILSRVETHPGSGVFVLADNISGSPVNGLNSFVDIGPRHRWRPGCVLGSGTAPNISVNLGTGINSLTFDNSWNFDHPVTYTGTGTDTVVGNNAGNAWQISDLATQAGTLNHGVARRWPSPASRTWSAASAPARTR